MALKNLLLDNLVKSPKYVGVLKSSLLNNFLIFWTSLKSSTLLLCSLVVNPWAKDDEIKVWMGFLPCSVAS